MLLVDYNVLLFGVLFLKLFGIRYAIFIMLVDLIAVNIKIYKIVYLI